MKELYLIPKADVVEFKVEDIIRTSGNLDNYTPVGNNDGDWTKLF